MVLLTHAVTPGNNGPHPHADAVVDVDVEQPKRVILHNSTFSLSIVNSQYTMHKNFVIS